MLATATIAKAQPAMRRQRPSISTRNTLRAGTAEEDGAGHSRIEPFVRTASYILKKFRGRRPSLIIHLHPTFFRFDQQEGTFSYKSEMRIVMEHLAKQTVPHELIDEFLRSGVVFYDGCLIVEVHNHRAKDAKLQKKTEGNDGSGNTVPFSMHNYNEHVTPSPYVPFPTRQGEPPAKKLKTSPEEDGMALDTEQLDREAMPAPDVKKKGDAQRFTTVLFPTDLSRHHELLFLASTPVTDSKARKNSRDGTVPSTPTTAQGKNKPAKMLLEDKDVYNFEAAYLLGTEGPLLLDPVKSPGGVAKVLEKLEHPLHCDSAPTGKSRKRTQADVAADDAQAAREEQKMLIMDERVKPSIGATAGVDSQASTSSLGFTRFKTLETIKQRHEEKERQRKEEEARSAMERRQQEMMQAHKRKMLEEQKRNATDAQQQQQAQQQMLLRQQMQQQQVQQKQQLQQQINAMAQNQQQQALQQQAAAMNQSSPIVRNQTPMMNSSPMVANANLMQGGYPMQATTSNQGAGSPPRPNSAMHHPGVGMARQVSQQQHMSRHATPQMAGATPLMANAQPMDINRQMSATPRLANHGSPAQNMQGTPNANVNMMMNMNTPQMNGTNLTPQQMMILQQQQQQRRIMQQQQMQQMQQMSPEQIQLQQQRLQANQASMAPQAYQQQLNRLQQIQLAQAQARQQQQQQQQQNNRMNGNAEAMARSASQQPGQQQQQQQQPGQQQQQQQQQANGASGGGGGGADVSIAQRQNAVLAARHRTAAMQQSMMHMQQELNNAAARHGGQVPPQLRAQILAQHQQRVAMQQQQFAQRAQQSAQQSAGMLGDVDNTEQYMRNLRGQQAMLARMTGQAALGQNGGAGQQQGGQQGQQQQNGGGQNGMMQQQQQQQGMGRGQLSMAQMQALRAAQAAQQQQQQGMNGTGGGNGQQGDVLAQQFQAMQNALSRPG